MGKSANDTITLEVAVMPPRPSPVDVSRPRQKHCHEGTTGCGSWVAALMQGHRSYMEDQFSVHELPGGCSFFGCFDGHGGSQVAEQAAAHFVQTLCSVDEWNQAVLDPSDVQGFTVALRAGCLRFDDMLRNGAYQRDDDSSDSDDAQSGSTAVFALVTPSHIIVGNIGDSRCVLRSDGQMIAMSHDQKPSDEKESSRITNAGGTVVMNRVNKVLAVARAFGDFEFKSNPELGQTEQQVSPEPEFVVHERCREDEFLLLCSDGVWDVVDNDDVSKWFDNNSGETNTTSCSNLLDRCLNDGSRDNMTALMLKFK